MSDEPGAARPKYQRIADDLKAAIEAGEYAPGDRLPGENVLAPRYGVAVMTARQALRVLKNQGLAESKRGAGVFVQAFHPIRRRSVQRLARDHWGSGKSIWDADDDRALSVDQVSVVQVIPPPHIADVLNTADGAMTCTRSRRYRLDERPVMLATAYLPYELVAGSAITRPDTGPGGIYARLADLGHAPVHFREEVRSRLPTSDEAARLGMSVERPVLKVCRTAYDSAGRAVEVQEMTLDSASYILEYEFDA